MGRFDFSEIWGAIDPKLKTTKQVLGPPHMTNVVKIGFKVWAVPVFGGGERGPCIGPRAKGGLALIEVQEIL